MTIGGQVHSGELHRLPGTREAPAHAMGTGGARLTRKSRAARHAQRDRSLARFSHHLTVEARHRPAITALRLLAVLNVLFKYASARRASHALY